MSAEFSPSSHVREESSITKWGFRVTVRPIYGLQKSPAGANILAPKGNISSSAAGATAASAGSTGTPSLLKQRSEFKQILLRFGGNEQTIVDWLNAMKIINVCLINQIQNLIEYDTIT